MQHPLAKVHRMFELVEPIATVSFSEVPNEAFLVLGMRNYWDGYFAGRAAPLGLAPAAVVHTVVGTASRWRCPPLSVAGRRR
ncbi:hypothetical protein B0E53_02016 [Micromonospora sp. MH33]|uniref:helix-turn-helix domain-containing protein n=1 Tax=Micromonospora sp. MH33 TaxID=1945509 RepID=UPI000D286421|nr:hypothetical protein [Micromonospora sp. MH33]PSK66036.1 hypothetical protein B0E53_02016 [Micromonospora sp. MH33]